MELYLFYYKLYLLIMQALQSAESYAVIYAPIIRENECNYIDGCILALIYHVIASFYFPKHRVHVYLSVGVCCIFKSARSELNALYKKIPLFSLLFRHLWLIFLWFVLAMAIVSEKWTPYSRRGRSALCMRCQALTVKVPIITREIFCRYVCV